MHGLGQIIAANRGSYYSGLPALSKSMEELIARQTWEREQMDFRHVRERAELPGKLQEKREAEEQVQAAKREWEEECARVKAEQLAHFLAYPEEHICERCGKQAPDVQSHSEDSDAVDFGFDGPHCEDCYAEESYNV